MKTKILFIVALLLSVITGTSSNEVSNAASENETVRICTMPATQKLAESWIAEYNKTNPALNFEINPVNLSGFAKHISENNTLGFLMQRPDVSMVSESMWRITVGRDVIVAVINSENPYTEMLNKKGVTVKELADIIANKQNRKWETLLGKNLNETVSIIILEEPEVLFSVSKFLGVDPSFLASANKKSTEEFLKTVSNDKYAIGFCRLANITDKAQHNFIAGIKLLPIDRNKNGRLDYNENFYADLDQFERSVWIGKYPRSLIYNIYAVATKFPENKEITNFISWIVTSGQPAIEQSGYTNLVYNEKQSTLEKLSPMMLAEQQSEKVYRLSTILLVVLVIVTGIIIIAFTVKYRIKKVKMPLGTFPKYAKVLNENVLSFPNGLYFDKSHTWVFMEEGGMVKFGIDDFIPNVTGEFTRVIMKNPGDAVKRREPVVTLVQKGKQITINAPVSGTIKEINETLVADPFMINSSPYNEGWVYKIEPSNWFREIRFFKLGETYKMWICSEITRLKDFLACSFNIKKLSEEKLAFQEGGELTLEPLKDLDPKIWEDFQSYFIESANKY